MSNQPQNQNAAQGANPNAAQAAGANVNVGKVFGTDVFDVVFNDKTEFQMSQSAKELLGKFAEHLRGIDEHLVSDLKIRGDFAAFNGKTMNKEGMKELMKKGNRGLDAFYYLMLSDDHQRKVTFELAQDTNVTDNEVFETMTNISAMVVTYLLTDNAERDANRRLPRFIRSITNLDKYNDLHDKLTRMPNVSFAIKESMEFVEFPRLSAALKARLKLGFAGHRVITIFRDHTTNLGMKIEPVDPNANPIVYDLKMDNYVGNVQLVQGIAGYEAFCINVLTIALKRPCVLLHTGFKTADILAVGSINKGVISFLVEAGIISKDELNRLYYTRHPLNVLLSKVELEQFIVKFNAVADQIIGSSIAGELQ